MMSDVNASRASYGSPSDTGEEQFFDELFAGTRMMVILRGLDPAESVAIAEKSWDHGVRAVEVTVAEESHLASLAAVVAAGKGRDVRVGAGSIYRVGQVSRIVELGAEFTVAPSIDADVSRACRAMGLPHMPGVATASDIVLAEKLGHSWLKVFPASDLGPAWITAMSGPFPWPKWVATGGVSLENARDFLSVGVRALGMGSRIDDWTTASFLLGE
jgi:2-dehydro-3-deoxyphosphogluconate aldolase/(4S)-4-hydroxy-2-oxoglutarate aldolase